MSGAAFILLFLFISSGSSESLPGTHGVPAAPLPDELSAARIQAALDRIPNGGEVVLPPGLYRCDRPIVLQRDNQTLRGAGPATILRLVDGANCPVVILGTTNNAPSRIVRNLRLADLAVDGNRANQQVECWKTRGDGSEIRNNGVTVRGVEDAVVERVLSCRARSGGLVSEREVRRLTVCGFTAWDNEFDGLAACRTRDSVFTRMLLHDNPGAGISVDLSFEHNVLSDSVLTGNGCGIFMREARHNLFTGLSIRQCREHGVFMAQASAQDAGGKWAMTPNTECVGNVFSGLQISDCLGAGFRVNDATCTNNLIQGAGFSGNAHGALSEARPGLVRTYAILNP